jgi:hypothetical protein
MVALRTIRNVQWVWILRVCPLRAIVHPLSAEGYRRRTSANLLAALVALSTIGAQAHIRWDLATGIQKYGEESKPLKKVMPVKFITSSQAT